MIRQSARPEIKTGKQSPRIDHVTFIIYNRGCEETPMTAFEALPICIFSFDRPHYIELTLRSIRRSIKVAGMVGPVLLFQDGCVNARTGEKKADPALLAKSRRIFLEVFPNGIIMGTLDQNLGIARNIYRGERWVFEENDYDCGLFFEDDMVVSAGYFVVLRKLYLLATENQRIAMYCAYGYDGVLSVDKQYEVKNRVGPMHHNWGFGLMRHAWLAREKYTARYMDVLEHVDYRDRPLLDIAYWYADLGWPILPTNQDLAKNVTLNTLGYVRISCAPILAKYIGETGQHYTPDEFRKLRFSEAQLFEDKFSAAEIVPTPLSESEIKAQILREREKFLELKLTPENLLEDVGFSRMSELLAMAKSNFGLIRKPGRYIRSAVGLFRDLWFGPNASFIVDPKINVSHIDIDGIYGSHLPPDATIVFRIGGGESQMLHVDPGSSFNVTLRTSKNFELLSTTVSTRCSHALDPFSRGKGSDRRPLAWRIIKIVLHTPEGPIALHGDGLERELDLSG